jgi:hypothetical protein
MRKVNGPNSALLGWSLVQDLMHNPSLVDRYRPTLGVMTKWRPFSYGLRWRTTVHVASLNNEALTLYGPGRMSTGRSCHSIIYRTSFRLSYTNNAQKNYRCIRFNNNKSEITRSAQDQSEITRKKNNLVVPQNQTKHQRRSTKIPTYNKKRKQSIFDWQKTNK